MEELARMYLNGLELHTTISNNIVTELYEFQLTFLLYLDKALHIQLFLFLNLKKYKIKQNAFFSFFHWLFLDLFSILDTKQKDNMLRNH